MDKIIQSVLVICVFNLLFICFASAQEIHLTMDKPNKKSNQNSVENTAKSANGSVIGQLNYVKDRFGNDCRAAFFDGKSYITLQNSSSLDVKNDFTFTAWLLLPKENFQWLTLICKGEHPMETDISPAYRVQLTSRTVSFNSPSTYDIGEMNRYVYPTGRWFHLSFVKNDDEISIYVDGKLLYTEKSTMKLYNNSEVINIGRDVPGSTEFFKGTMDDVRFFTKALNKNQISRIFKDDSYKNLGSACPVQPVVEDIPEITTNTNSFDSDLSQIDIPEITTNTNNSDSDLSQIDVPEITTNTNSSDFDLSQIDIPEITTNTNNSDFDLSQIDIPEITTNTNNSDSDLSQIDVPEITTNTNAGNSNSSNDSDQSNTSQTTTNTNINSGSFTEIDLDTDQPINLKNIRFEQSKDVFLAIAYPELENLLLIMKSNPTLKISLNGHTDNVGNFHKNKILSGQRIAAVKKYLTDKGIDKNRILHLNAYGDIKPITDNSNEELRKMNRRVEVLIVSR